MPAGIRSSKSWAKEAWAEAKYADQRSDIYSLGVILYEMVTGQMPFLGDTPLSVAMKHKTEAPKNPKDLNSQIPEDLSLLILKCLEKDKENRYQSSEEVGAALEGIQKGIPLTEKVIPERKPITSKEITVKIKLKKIFVPAVAVLLALAAASIFLFRSQGPRLDLNRIVVAVFENRTGNPDLDHLGLMAHDWISQGLQQTGDVSVATWLPEKTSEKDKKEKDFVRWISTETDAGKVVTGNYYLQGDILQFHASVHDADKEKLLHALEPVSGSVEDPMKTLETLRQRVMGQLAISLDARWGAYALREFQIPTYDSYREFIVGSEFFNRYEHKRAIEHFNKAYALDPDFIYPLFLIVHSHINSGEPAKAEPLIEKLEQNRDKLSLVNRYFLDYTKAELNCNWIDAYRFAGSAVQLNVSFR